MSAQSQSPIAHVDTLAIVGVGLIGGSFAAACREAGLVKRILGAGRRPETLATALELGLIDEAVSLKEAAERADLIFIAAPVGAFATIFSELAPWLKAGSLLTDGGSTKQNVVDAARLGLKDRIGQFVPSHPMAGSHEKGPQAADANLYKGRRVILTPLPENDSKSVELIRNIWQGCGAKVVSLEPAQHDKAVAAVSHMPHWIAALFMQHIIQSEDVETKLQTAGTGFRDFTRVAQGSGEMWRDIFIANRSAMLSEIAAFRKVLDRAEQALQESDEAWLMDMLETSAHARANWTGNQS